MSNRILTKHVHRLHFGVLESHAPGDPAPDWVTNADAFVEAVKPDDTTPASTASTPPASGTDNEVVDDLTDLTLDGLKDVAVDLGIAKSGSKGDLLERIRAKRAADAAENNSNDDTARAALIEQARAAGHEVDDSMSDTELQVLIEGA